MYSLEELRLALRQPNIAIKEINKRSHMLACRSSFNEDGKGIFEKDWDNLVILDACRLDYFKQEIQNYSFNGDLSTFISKGSATEEFLRANFKDKHLDDVVYVTSNGQYGIHHESINSRVYKYRDVSHESKKPQGVDPQSVTDAALKESRAHPDKRFIIHYTPPHQPYIGPKYGGIGSKKGLPVLLGQDGVTPERIRNAYRENLQIALDSVSNLISRIIGKTVITADHGELLGERVWPIPIRMWGHPSGIYHPALVKVPWYEIPFEERRSAVPEEPIGNVNDVDEELVQQRLEHLGYA